MDRSECARTGAVCTRGLWMTTYCVGRNPHGHDGLIVLSDLTVSARHCTLTPCGNGFFEIADNNSTNGTFVRDKGVWRQISKAKVSERDEVRLELYRVGSRPSRPRG